MTQHEDDLTPTLADAARRRADLRDALLEVERATSRPAVGREADWSKEVALQLEDLDRALEEHIEVTERTEGLYAEISARAPHLSGKIDRLRQEHPTLRGGANDLRTRLLETGVGESWPLEEARDDVQRLLGKLVRHRQLGSDLVWEAYNLDIGGIE